VKSTLVNICVLLNQSCNTGELCWLLKSAQSLTCAIRTPRVLPTTSRTPWLRFGDVINLVKFASILEHFKSSITQHIRVSFYLFIKWWHFLVGKSIECSCKTINDDDNDKTSPLNSTTIRMQNWKNYAKWIKWTSLNIKMWIGPTVLLRTIAGYRFVLINKFDAVRISDINRLWSF